MGTRTWFDEERMQGNVLDRMCTGIDDSECVVVFVTQNYLDKVGGVNGPQDNCKKEFEYAERTKGAEVICGRHGLCIYPYSFCLSDTLQFMCLYRSLND